MNQKVFTLLEVVILGGLVLFVMYIGGAFKGRDPAPTPQPTATSVQPTSDSILRAVFVTVNPTSTQRPTNSPTLTSTPPPMTQPTGLIAFESNRDGNSEIYVADVESGAQTNLTDNPAQDYLIGWSPDGSRIAFFSTRAGWPEIYLMNADGSGLARLTNTKGTDTAYAHPVSWSPDGQQLLAVRSSPWFVSRAILPSYLDVIRVDGSGVTNLYQRNEARILQPGWSPDGNYIALAISGNTEYGFYVGKAGELPLKLSLMPNGYFCSNTVWSPDNKLTCYENSLVTINPDGSDKKTVGFMDGYPSSIVWSPDGQHVASIAANYSLTTAVLGLYVLNPGHLQGRNEVPIEHTLLDISAPSWSPDSQWIAYNARQSEDHTDIFILNIYDNTQQFQLTNEAGHNVSPQWQP